MVVHQRPTELQAELPSSVHAVDLARLCELLHIDEGELIEGFQAHPTISEMHGVVVDAGQDVPFEAVGQQHGDDEDEEIARPPPLLEHEREDEEDDEAGLDRADSAARLNVVVDDGRELAEEVAGMPSAEVLAGLGDEEELKARPPLHPVTAKKKKSRYLCRQVLLTAAARPSDDGAPPKCLMQLGSQPLIGHILTQLYAAGVERIVIVMAAGGAEITQAVKRTPFYSKLEIEFLDLGVDNREGHARSILAARELFKRGPFMIHTSDHIFDKSIITKMMSYDLDEDIACVLVETDVFGLVGMPETAVRVQLGPEKIMRIGRNLEQYEGVDAGLFLSSIAIFDALEELAEKKKYFTLADALNFFTQYNKLAYLPTAGETWFSIETEEQLAYTKDNEGVSILSPWTVFLASTRTPVPDPNLTKNVVFGISAPDQEESLRVAGSVEAKTLFEGFIVGVKNSDRTDDAVSISVEDSAVRSPEANDATPLLPLTREGTGTFLSSSRSKVSRATSFLEKGTVEESFVVSFPMDDETSVSFNDLSSARHAFLIEMNADPAEAVSANSQYMLAVPMAEPLQQVRKESLQLPSDIMQIALETKGCDEEIEVKLVVKRQVPLIGFILLLTSLVTLSSVGVALDMEDHVTPMLKLFWRQSATCLATIPFSYFSIRKNGLPPFSFANLGSMLVAGISYAIYLGAFVFALSLTSVGHATLFNNSHSLMIVVLKATVGQPVALLEAVGALIGMTGGALTTLDTNGITKGNIIPPTTVGDMIALAGALGGAMYFIQAKKLRPKMDLIVFMTLLTGISATCIFGVVLLRGERVTFSFDVNYGMFGWLNPLPNRLLTALYLTFVCDFMGTMGYVSVMKYFDPIVVSVVCLLEPVVANGLGILMRVDSMPGSMGLIGASLVLGGTLLVILVQSRKTEHLDATEAIKAVNNTPKPLFSTRKRMTRGSPTYGSTHSMH